MRTKKLKHMTMIKFNRQPLDKSFNNLLDDFFNEVPVKWGRDWNGNYVPAVNIHETDEAFHLEMNAPGRNKEDFKINVEENVLTIAFEKKEEKVNDAFKTIRREFSFESFK